MYVCGNLASKIFRYESIFIDVTRHWFSAAEPFEQRRVDGPRVRSHAGREGVRPTRAAQPRRFGGYGQNGRQQRATDSVDGEQSQTDLKDTQNIIKI